MHFKKFQRSNKKYKGNEKIFQNKGNENTLIFVNGARAEIIGIFIAFNVYITKGELN